MTIWTDEQEQQLKSLYEAGLSCARISTTMDCGFSRNAVIAKVHRLDLKLRGNGGNYSGNGRGPKLRTAEAKTKPRVRLVRVNTNSNARRVVLAHEPIELKALRCAEIVPLNLPLLENEGCWWPYGDGPMTFCGHLKMDGISYCGPHNALSKGAGTYSERTATLVPALVAG
jgi:hypothetical protein